MAKRSKANNNADSNHGPQQKKKFHIHDIRSIKPKTENQKLLFDYWQDDISLFLYGTAGTGKTFLAMYLSLLEVIDGSNSPYDRLVIIRSNAAVRDMGHLPGTAEEKMAQYEKPYVNICNELFQWSKSFENLKKIGKIEFESTAFLRGITYDNAIILVDECQNMTFQELDTIATRVGENSKIIFCGDKAQNDLLKSRNDISGFKDFLEIIKRMHTRAKTIEFTREDIVRSGWVKDYIIEKERLLS